VLRPAVRGEIALERLDALAEDEGLRVVDLFGDAKDLAANFGVLRLQVEQGDGHFGR